MPISPMRHRDRSLPSQDKFENQSRMRTNATYKLKSFVTPMIKKKRARRKNKEGKAVEAAVQCVLLANGSLNVENFDSQPCVKMVKTDASHKLTQTDDLKFMYYVDSEGTTAANKSMIKDETIRSSVSVGCDIDAVYNQKLKQELKHSRKAIQQQGALHAMKIKSIRKEMQELRAYDIEEKRRLSEELNKLRESNNNLFEKCCHLELRNEGLHKALSNVS
eukprot:g5248.t1